MPIDFTDARRMRLDVEFYFAAAHRLPRYEGPCFRLHGHNYKFFVSVEGEVDPRTGMIADFGKIKEVVGDEVLARVDHRNLNDVLDNPTAENIARWIWEVLAPHVLHLVDEQCDPDSEIRRHRRGVEKQLGQVDLDVPGVRAPPCCRSVDARLPAVPRLSR